MRTRFAVLILVILAAATPMSSANAQGSRLLSSCTGKAALGVGAGALLGGLAASKGQKTEGAVLGAALGGLGTFGVCRYLDTRATARIERAYRTAASSNRAYSTSWSTKSGQQRLYVAQPASDGPYCRRLHATLTVPGGIQETLPEEIYCRDAKGVWRPT